MIKVIITDDHKIVRDGIKSILADVKELEIVAEAGNGQELIQLLTHLSADVILMDLNMPYMDGLETTQYVKERFPTIQVLALSMQDQESYVRQILNAGASGYIPKSSNKEELIFAIKTVAAGNKFLCTELAYKLLETTQTPPVPTLPGIAMENLSKCELNVLKLIAEGFTNAEIADKLFNSKRTIESHRQSLLLKTHCKNTAALVKYALVNNLIQ